MSAATNSSSSSGIDFSSGSYSSSSSSGGDGGSDSWTALILSVTLTALYAFLSVVSVVQLIRIKWNRHSALSFQFLFLFLVALHSVARVFFFIDLSYVPTIIVLYVFWLPSDLQFAIFSLFILFYSSLLPSWAYTKRIYINLWLIINGGAMTLTVLYITLPCLSNCNVTDTMEMYHHAYILAQTIVLLIIYAYHGYILHCTSQSAHYHLLLGIHHPPFPLWLLTVFFLSVFVGHSVISTLGALNIYAIELGGNEGGLKQVGLLAFLLFVWWEILPPLLVVIYFHRIPSPTSSPSSIHHAETQFTQLSDDDASAGFCCCQLSSRTTRVYPDDDSVSADDTNVSSDPQVISSYAYSNYVTGDDLDADLLAAAPSSPYTNKSLSMAFPTHTHLTPVNTGAVSSTTHLPYNYPPPPILSSAPRKLHTTSSLPAKIIKQQQTVPTRNNINGHSPPAPFATPAPMRPIQYQQQQQRERIVLPNRRDELAGTPQSDSDEEDSITSI